MITPKKSYIRVRLASPYPTVARKMRMQNVRISNGFHLLKRGAQYNGNQERESDFNDFNEQNVIFDARYNLAVANSHIPGWVLLAAN